MGWQGQYTLPPMEASDWEASPTLKEKSGLLPAAQSEVRSQLVHWAGIGQDPAGRALVWLKVKVVLQLIQRASRKR